MDILKLLLLPDDEKHRIFCSLCFTVDEQFTHVDDLMEIVDETSNNTTTTIRNIFNSFFPFYELLSQQTCDKCTTLIIEMDTMIRQGIKKIKLIEKISERINNESQSGCVNKKLTIIIQKDQIASHEYKTTQKIAPTGLLRLFDHNFVCDTCKRSFNKLFLLKAHMKSHKTGQPISHLTETLEQRNHAKETKRKKIYRCNVKDCDYNSCNNYDLNAHMNRKHLNCRPHACTKCQKCFLSNKNLQEHYKTHEMDRNKMICDICGECFAHEKSLKYHLRSHDNFRPYTCIDCGHKFVSISKRNEHAKRKHGPKTFNCNLCNKKYSIGKELKRHLKIIHKAADQDCDQATV